MRNEPKLAKLRHIQWKSTTKSITPRVNDIPQNWNGTYQARTTSQGEDVIDLDTFRLRPRLNLSSGEFQERMGEQLCLQYAQLGHRADVCDKQNELKQFNPRAGNWQPTKRTALWQQRPKIQEMEVEKEAEESGNEECPK